MRWFYVLLLFVLTACGKPADKPLSALWVSEDGTTLTLFSNLTYSVNVPGQQLEHGYYYRGPDSFIFGPDSEQQYTCSASVQPEQEIKLWNCSGGILAGKTEDFLFKQ